MENHVENEMESTIILGLYGDNGKEMETTIMELHRVSG